MEALAAQYDDKHYEDKQIRGVWHVRIGYSDDNVALVLLTFCIYHRYN